MDALNQIVKQHEVNVKAQLPLVVDGIMRRTVDNTKRKYASLYSGNSPTPHQLTNAGVYVGKVFSSGLSATGMVMPMAAPQPSYFGQRTYAPFAQMYETSRILNLKASNLRAGRKVFWSSKPVQPSAQAYMTQELKRQVAAAGLQTK